MSRPETPYEAASYDLNQFRERRMDERRADQRASADRRLPQQKKGKSAQPSGNGASDPAGNGQDGSDPSYGARTSPPAD